MANQDKPEKGASVISDDVAMPSIGTHVQVLRDGAGQEGIYHAAIVVRHLNDPELGNVLELRLSDSRGIQRTWPTSTIRLSSAA